MVILDKPYVSEEMKVYLAESQVPVLDNEVARQEGAGWNWRILSPSEFAAAVNGQTRLYTISENALDWIGKHLPEFPLQAAIAVTKDKVRFREMLRSVYPDFFFCSGTLEELEEIEASSLPLPVILKPAVGFFSIGVYTIYSPEDWQKALAEIRHQRTGWSASFPETVVGQDRFIVEAYIHGEEYALDAYFNQDGEAVILNIMKHDFTDATDVSDRLYYTGHEVVSKWLEPFTDYLNRMNGALGARNFPFHLELRVDGDQILPIECNPMRFAGWCTTDITWFAFGFRTYQYFLEDRKPDWAGLLAGKEGRTFALVILDKGGRTEPPATHIDYDALCNSFQRVLHMRKLDYHKFPVYGFVFTDTPHDHRQELDQIMTSTLEEFIRR